ncbi:cyclin-dependent kinase 6-like [Oncorhynchus tshawytscha]|uniref:cyclin-dependent kinase 6-like n=1 Tax=Oncorhynchus tshawytscha TaxID=74940 RepID=UPI001C3CD5A0|nr:cyclin-dependent kinase 6-like [Oncorhynchus tshawytscha]XP_042163395.1 cyclin-dependent kinase 6-like [Oncorhynchus tshawytscha]
MGAMNIRMRKYLQRGEGAYGKEYRTREVCNQQRLVAVKKLNVPGDTESGIPAFMIREVALLRKIGYFNHPNIVKWLDVSAGLKNRSLDLTLVFEYRDQDLSTFLTMVPSTGLSLDKIKGCGGAAAAGAGLPAHKHAGALRSEARECTVVTLWYRGP